MIPRFRYWPTIFQLGTRPVDKRIEGHSSDLFVRFGLRDATWQIRVDDDPRIGIRVSMNEKRVLPIQHLLKMVIYVFHPSRWSILPPTENGG